MSYKLLAVGVAALICLGACGSGGPDAAATMPVDAASDVPVGTQALMVAFSDTIVEFRIVDEVRIEPARSSPEGQSYMIDRDLVAEVTTVLQASVEEGLPAEGERFTFRHQGWWVADGTGQPILMVEHGREIEVGGLYVAAFTVGSTVDDERLNLATSDSLHRSVDGVVTPLGDDDPFPDVSGITIETLLSEFQSTASRPDVAQFGGLSPAEKQLQPIESLQN